MTRKRLVLLVAVIVVIIGIVLLTRKSGTKEGQMEYQYDTVSVGDVSKSISASGKLDLFRSEIVVSNINGIATQIPADFNQSVKAGDLLAHIDSTEVDINFANAKETFKRVSLELESMKDFFESKKTLFEEKLISQKEVDESRRNYEKSLTLYNQNKIAYDTAAGAVSAKNIYAPISGVILQRDVELRQSVVAGKPLFTIAPDMKKLKLVINVDESDIGYVKSGLPVNFSVSAYPDKVFTGTIMQVRMNPVMLAIGPTNKIVTYESLVECDNTNMLLRPGMTVTALVNISRKSGVLRVPNAAFMISPIPVDNSIGKKFVWKKESLSLQTIPMRRIEVKTGIMGDDYTEILGSDLKEGDEILVGMHSKFDMKGLTDGK
ncbi:MAG TPA: efflux RND transporter periplasmic adaptor subunit [Spirochaetota bacterium]|nr:efflux RND transporter periplasmic adaptor subunit [Spirochaetota bacterium]